MTDSVILVVDIFQFRLSYQSKFSVSFFQCFPFLSSLTLPELNCIRQWDESVSVAVDWNNTVSTVCVLAGIKQMNCTIEQLGPKLKISWPMPTYMCRRASVYVVYMALAMVQYRRWLYNENWSNIYSIQLLVFPISFCFLIFSVIVMANGIKFYPLTEWIRFRWLVKTCFNKPEIVDSNFAPRCRHLPRSTKHYVVFDSAHLAPLCEKQNITYCIVVSGRY